MNAHNPDSMFERLRRTDLQIRPSIDFDPRRTRSVTSQSLFQGDREIGIEHAGSLYRLKITRQGKLILNK